ncbi:hypothetical protein [Ethanoligenens harbinense]|uniref:Uncharacterized protein n=1 Tax=Ethanoligenens harbinense (strain DSM 18485 / JCM 12961 / CGMCC 1.5033 / YUAN-3) TaxID=663278 RepID=E6U447_ETHHY|nr:hypothetical protein [Ethanoligenens harbinense]ADU26547.1 hypothetical protein Ethha_0994 [Ethanoligenens harbinense YUAN-3]AVQ95673.1 hypothetical protein CXQ68_05150 [Ethanoligenens harbinense YUAN-3]AYF38336.1 hypothetical protein CXP51_05010 [Ethanoligenens harbinense]AYF41081.1 hypothetical protein CN246_05140 [Ethanoligenens harbinense]QCN91912.1 hypothetical protein DRA42_05165 [Ethanoligenens harbinense]
MRQKRKFFYIFFTVLCGLAAGILFSVSSSVLAAGTGDSSSAVCNAEVNSNGACDGSTCQAGCCNGEATVSCTTANTASKNDSMAAVGLAAAIGVAAAAVIGFFLLHHKKVR